MANPDDERLARLLPLLRRRAGFTQEQLAALAGVPRRAVIDVEAGRIGSIPIERLRRPSASGRHALASSRYALAPWAASQSA